MFKIKKHYRAKPQSWFWGKPNSYYLEWTYFRHPIGRRQWVSQCEIDSIDEDGMGCSPRTRDRLKLPDAYDDIGRSRGFYVKCWKDLTRKKKQWE